MRVLQVEFISRIDAQKRRAQFDVTGKTDNEAKIYANTKTRELRESGMLDYSFYEVEETKFLFEKNRSWTK